jgi:hypothetical protein
MQPTLLDKLLPQLATTLIGKITPLQQSSFVYDNIKILYTLASVRGPKTIIKLMPHQVSDLMSVYEFVVGVPEEEWQCRYFAILWLSLIVMIPFDLVAVDSEVGRKLFDLAKLHIPLASKEGEAAAALLARLACRKDVALEQVLQDIMPKIKSSGHEAKNVLYALHLICKHCPTDRILPFACILSANLEHCAQGDTLNRKLRVKCLGRLGVLLTGIDESEEMESIIGSILQSLRDKDTVVRYSAAKSLARIASRLPVDMQGEIEDAVLGIFEDDYDAELDSADACSDSAWHGASLALAELARRNLVGNIPAIIKWTLRALFFDIQKASCSVGSHVRDAACFVLWALFRSSVKTLAQGDEIAEALVCASVFDREISVRRAASAAFQEGVGRMGIFPHGIDILQLTDYFNIGNRHNAYLKVAVDVAAYEEYRGALVDCLMKRGILHWDPVIRDVAAQSLGRMASLYQIVKLDPIMTLLKQPSHAAKHGGMLALAYLSPALSNLELQSVQQVTRRLSKSDVSHGASDLIRVAACTLIQHVCEAFVSKSGWQVDWELLLISLVRKEEICQTAAVLAISSASKLEVPDTVLDRLIAGMTGQDCVVKRASASALASVCPLHLTIEKQVQILHVLMDAAIVQKSSKSLNYDAESKRNAILAVSSFFLATQVNFPTKYSQETHERIVGICLKGLEDYASDHRGDVGSFVRAASITALTDILTQFPLQDEVKVFEGILRVGCEKIDRLRAVAGRGLMDLCRRPRMDRVVCELEACLKEMDVDWVNPSSLFPSVMPLLKHSTAVKPVLHGTILCIGGLTESLSRHASNSLVDYLASIEDAAAFTECFMEIWKENVGRARIVSPIMFTLEMLLVNGIPMSDSDAFWKDVLDLIAKSVKQDVKRLLLAVKLVSAICLIAPDAVENLKSFLSSEFPAVRRRAHEEMTMVFPVLNMDVPELNE